MAEPQHCANMGHQLITSVVSGKKRKHSETNSSKSNPNETADNLSPEGHLHSSNSCQLCQKLAIHLLEISCQSTHRFCYDCFYNWIRDCILVKSQIIDDFVQLLIEILFNRLETRCTQMPD